MVADPLKLATTKSSPLSFRLPKVSLTITLSMKGTPAVVLEKLVSVKNEFNVDVFEGKTAIASGLPEMWMPFKVSETENVPESVDANVNAVEPSKVVTRATCDGAWLLMTRASLRKLEADLRVLPYTSRGVMVTIRLSPATALTLLSVPVVFASTFDGRISREIGLAAMAIPVTKTCTKYGPAVVVENDTEYVPNEEVDGVTVRAMEPGPTTTKSKSVDL